MNRQEEIKEIRRYIWEEVEGYDLTWESDCDKLAERLYKDGWRRQIEAEWIPNDVYYSPMNCYVVQGYTCSNCKTKTDNYSNYCSYCGAKMTIKGE